MSPHIIIGKSSITHQSTLGAKSPAPTHQIFTGRKCIAANDRVHPRRAKGDCTHGGAQPAFGETTCWAGSSSCNPDNLSNRNRVSEDPNVPPAPAVSAGGTTRVQSRVNSHEKWCVRSRLAPIRRPIATAAHVTRGERGSRRYVGSIGWDAHSGHCLLPKLWSADQCGDQPDARVRCEEHRKQSEP